jgi:hypothetical protein
VSAPKVILTRNRDYCTGALAVGIPKVGLLASKMVVKFLNVRGLLVEMIYQIGAAYGFDEFREGDYLVILNLALPIQKLANLGMDLLLGDLITDPIIPAISNIILFLAVGYAACEFYESKAKGVVITIASLKAFIALEKTVEAYLEETISEKSTIEATVVEAVAVKEHLVLS